MRFRHFLSATIALLGAAGTALAAPPPPEFERDVKPILEQHCFKCHGPEKQKGGLRLDRKEAVLAGGDSEMPAIIPGNALKSHLLKLVSSNDPDEIMPPKGERLKPAEIAVLQRWVDTGAHWTTTAAAAPATTRPATTQALEAAGPEQQITAQNRQFWSFVPPKRVEPPAVKDGNWARGRIDRFVLAGLEARGIKPAEEASRLTLIRRLSFDLTGLPPTPAEVETYLSDQRPDAYERLVDRLLASPRFGERLASLWLPLARYAEDQAHQVGSDTKFFYPMAWKYRDWVVSAFNRDLPYDQFVLFQIAADKAPGASPDDQVALGFLGLGPKYYNRNRLEVMADEWEDRVDTVTRTLLGLTVACARCHDHKFDPISQRDYTALAGVFASTRMVNKTPDGKAQKGDLAADKLDPATIHVVEEGDVADLNLFIRGNVNRKGPVIPRRFLSILSPSQLMAFKQGSGRLELATAIVARSNPLTARVMVNRLWGTLLGRPIVVTPSNFGHSGQPPTHPELLDDLAVRFMDNGWSIKSIVRDIVCSATYRQSASLRGDGARVDPSNDLFGRMTRRRLTIEQWRDSVLFANGRLTFLGGKSVELDEPTNTQRTLYARISRLKLNDVLNQFDYPDANVHAETRSVTNTPIQKLFVLNSPFMIEQAKAFARRTAEGARSGDEARIKYAYKLLFGRGPTADELRLGIEFLQEPENEQLTRWEQYAQVLLASNEALYVD